MHVGAPSVGHLEGALVKSFVLLLVLFSAALVPALASATEVTCYGSTRDDADITNVTLEIDTKAGNYSLVTKGEVTSSGTAKALSDLEPGSTVTISLLELGLKGRSGALVIQRYGREHNTASAQLGGEDLSIQFCAD